MGLSLQLVGTAFTNAPAMLKDPILDAGVGPLAWDASNTSSWESGAAPAASSPDKVLNLVKNGSTNDGVWAGSAFSNVAYAGNGFDFASNTAAFLNFGSYDPGTDNHLFIVWVKLKEVSGNLAGLLSQMTSYGGAPGGSWGIALSSNGLAPRFYLFDPTTADNTRLQPLWTTTAADGDLVQLAGEVNFTTGKLNQYYNGALDKETSLTANYTRFRAGVADKIGFGSLKGDSMITSAFKGRGYRGYIENLSVSGRNAASVVAADFAEFDGRFS